MNTRQLQYAITLAKVRNFSQVADMLHISQPALSKQIINLEGELGLKIFDRSTTPLTLTAAGEYFIREAEELCYREEQLLRSMEQYKSGEAGRLTIGITPFRSSYLIPQVVKKIRDRYPGTMVKLHEAGNTQLRTDAQEGKFDFAVVNLPVDEAALDVMPLESDRLVLVAPKEYESMLDVTDDGLDFRSCKELPFVVVGQSQEMRQLFEQLCFQADFSPNVAAEVVSLTTAWAMTCAGVGATILPLQYVKSMPRQENVFVAKLRDAVYFRQPAVITKRGQYLSEATRYAIQVLTELFKEI